VACAGVARPARSDAAAAAMVLMIVPWLLRRPRLGPAR
jgi:hypothetical protein